MGLRGVLSRVQHLEFFINHHHDGFELCQKLNSTDEGGHEASDWEDSAKPWRNDMLEQLARATPHYHKLVFRTCKMCFNLSRWY